MPLRVSAIAALSFGLSLGGFWHSNVAFAATPTVDVLPCQVEEGHDPNYTAALNFPVVLSSPSTEEVTVYLDVRLGTATAADIYAKPRGVTFTPGETKQFFFVIVRGDIEVENDETVIAFIKSAQNATVGQSEATGTIINDDLPGAHYLYVDPIVIDEGNSETTIAGVHVRLVPASDVAVSVKIESADDTATVSDGDYQGVSTLLTFKPGQVDQIVPVTIFGDLKDEFTEQFKMRLSNAMGAFLATPESNVSIRNDEVAPTWTVQNVRAKEGTGGFSEMTFTIELNKPPVGQMVFSYQAMGITAILGEDFSITEKQYVTIQNPNTRADFKVLIVADAISECDEGFNILVRDANLKDDRTFTGIIENDDATVAAGVTCGDPLVFRNSPIDDKGNQPNSGGPSVDAGLSVFADSGVSSGGLGTNPPFDANWPIENQPGNQDAATTVHFDAGTAYGGDEGDDEGCTCSFGHKTRRQTGAGILILCCVMLVGLRSRRISSK